MELDNTKFNSSLHQLVSIITALKDIGHLDLALRLERIKEELLMSIENELEEDMGLQEWVLGIALKKGAKSLVKIVISFLTSVALVNALKALGIEFNVDQHALELGLTAALNSGFEILRNFLKVKFGVKNI